jgi:alpha-galactosidase
MAKGSARLEVSDDLLTITGATGKKILANCYGGVQLSNGANFSMHGMARSHHETEDGIVVEAGGNEVLPRLQWEANVLKKNQVRVTLTITNTTSASFAIERMDVLVCRGGYRGIDPNDLLVRRTGWQMSSPAAVRVPFTSEDPWLQPPLHAPIMLPSSADQRHLPWMTVLQSKSEKPLLIGFGGAKDYLGMINIRSSSTGHRITAANYLEGIELKPGETFVSEPLLLMWGQTEQQLLEGYGDYLHDAMAARVPEHVPTGWSHWLYYFANVTEQDILENLRIINEKNLPFEYVQVDDGFQTFFGDWLSINDKFPHGMKYVADKIREAGRKPGIWLSPFMADARSEVVAKHPDWFLHDFSGRLINVNRHGDPYWPAPNYGLDLTHPDAYAWLKNVVTVMCKEWGYEYLKIDFLYAGAIRAKRYDQNVTSVQAYRRGMELIREIAGERLILGCGAPLLCSVGLVDDMRIGPDLSWEFDTASGPRPKDHTIPISREPLLSLFSHLWMNKRLWINDSDYVRTRQHDISLGWAETLALTTLIAMGGGALYDSDKLATLEEEGYDLLDRLFPVADVAPAPVDRTTGKPSRLLSEVKRGDGAWFIGAKFNWHDEPRDHAFYPSKWNLPLARYHIYDLLGKKYLGAHVYQHLPEVSARGAAVYSICPTSNYPQVIATEGHLLGPAGDIDTVTWKDNVLNITLSSGRRTDTKVLVHVPLSYKLVSQDNCEIISKSRVVYTIKPDGETCTLTFKSRMAS